MLSKKLTIFVTELVAFRQCEMQYYFIKRRIPFSQLESSMSVKLEHGKKIHSSLYNEFYRNSIFSASFNEILERTMADKKIRSIREFRVLKETDSYQLVGRIDEIEFRPDRIIIIDDKCIDSLSPLDKIKYKDQLLIYTSMLFEQYLPFTDIYFQLRQAESKHIFFEESFRPQYTYDWEYDLSILLEYWAGNISLQKTSDTSKCSTCLFNSICHEL